MQDKNVTLYYAHDPMCSWCYGFRPVWQTLADWCQGKINIKYLLGGLAPDCDDVMPERMQHDIESYWRTIQRTIPDTEFNFAFWQQNQPRRSTYRACRAVIAARLQQPDSEYEMIRLIQNAYYLEAKNPSDREPLIACAEKCALDIARFSNDLDAPQLQQLLQLELEQCAELHLRSFPSLLLAVNGQFYPIAIDYNNADSMMNDMALVLNKEAIN